MDGPGARVAGKHEDCGEPCPLGPDGEPLLKVAHAWDSTPSLIPSCSLPLLSDSQKNNNDLPHPPE